MIIGYIYTMYILYMHICIVYIMHILYILCIMYPLYIICCVYIVCIVYIYMQYAHTHYC